MRSRPNDKRDNRDDTLTHRSEGLTVRPVAVVVVVVADSPASRGLALVLLGMHTLCTDPTD